MKTLFFILLLTLTSCDTKDDLPKLPPITTTGENTFGCYVDGILLTPRDPEPKFSLIGQKKGLQISGNYPDYLEIEASNYKDDSVGRIEIYLGEVNFSNTGSYPLTSSNCIPKKDGIIDAKIFVRWYDKETKELELYCSVEGSGEVILLRSDDNVMSGTFNGVVKQRDNGSKTLSISEGRFDFNFNTLRDKKYP